MPRRPPTASAPRAGQPDATRTSSGCWACPVGGTAGWPSRSPCSRTPWPSRRRSVIRPRGPMWRPPWRTRCPTWASVPEPARCSTAPSRPSPRGTAGTTESMRRPNAASSPRPAAATRTPNDGRDSAWSWRPATAGSPGSGRASGRASWTHCSSSAVTTKPGRSPARCWPGRGATTRSAGWRAP